MSPACSSTFKWRETAGRLIGKGCANSVTVALPRPSRTRMSRRVGSASAENTLLS